MFGRQYWGRQFWGTGYWGKPDVTISRSPGYWGRQYWGISMWGQEYWGKATLTGVGNMPLLKTTTLGKSMIR